MKPILCVKTFFLLLFLQAHVVAQLASKNQLLSIMSKKQHELEGRLDEMLSRIAKETQEIKDLEQQLTEGETLFWHCYDLLFVLEQRFC